MTRDVTLPIGIGDGVQIRKLAGECLKRVPLDQKIRLLGVRASGLVAIKGVDFTTHSIQTALPF